MNPIELSLFGNRLAAVCDEVGAVLRRSAFSPNIRDRLDFSAAVFDAGGGLCAQAAHIPVHLGSMAYAMSDLVSGTEWQPGDQLIVNNPFLGGTHLPDVTVVAPVFAAGRLAAFVANRAHHADIGAETPGSMPLSSRLDEEGLVISPTLLVRHGELDQELLGELTGATRNPDEASGDFQAQLSANHAGVGRLTGLIEEMGLAAFERGLVALNDYAERLALAALREIPDGDYCFDDALDGDGLSDRQVAIRLRLSIAGGQVLANFAGTAGQVAGNLNCPLSVAAAGVYYVFRCLMPDQTPACAGAFRPIRISAPAGSLLNARPPAAVAAGNVETSTRVVDVVCGALAQALPDRIPAASHGSMNNLAMGRAAAQGGWDYYETIGGGMGAGATGGGLSAVQTHMTNTLNTPVEVLEGRFPLRVRRYSIRYGSGGHGQRWGGDGLIREFEFLAPATFSLLTERRVLAPWGLLDGLPGLPGDNRLNGEPLPGKYQGNAAAGDRLRIETPGGGGFGFAVEPVTARG